MQHFSTISQWAKHISGDVNELATPLYTSLHINGDALLKLPWRIRRTKTNGEPMKIFLCVIAVAISVTLAFGQDDFDSGATLTASDLNALFGGGRGGSRGGNSLQNLITNPEATLVQIKETLRSRKIPLDKTQEKSLQKLLETESKTLRSFMETQFANSGNNRGDNRGNNLNNPVARLDTLVLKHNTELLAAIKTDLYKLNAMAAQ
jgi:hypothetical protein